MLLFGIRYFGSIQVNVFLRVNIILNDSLIICFVLERIKDDLISYIKMTISYIKASNGLIYCNLLLKNEEFKYIL